MERCLSALEYGLFLFEEGVHADLVILALEADGLGVGLQIQELLQGHVDGVVDHILGHAQGHPGAVSQLLGQLFGLGEQLVMGDDPVDDTHVPGLLGADGTPGENQLLGPLEAHQPGQGVHARQVGDQAHVGEGHAELGLVGGQDQIRLHGDAETGPHGKAVNCGDGGLGHVHEGGNHCPERLHVVIAGLGGGEALAELLQIAAGAEGPLRSGEDHRADIRVGGHVLVGGEELGGELILQGVHGLGVVHLDEGHALLLGEDDGIISHTTRLLTCRSRSSSHSRRSSPPASGPASACLPAWHPAAS